MLNYAIYAGKIYSNSSEKISRKESNKVNKANNLEFFLLPKNQELINTEKLGKVDPFSLNNKKELDQFGNIALLGVFSTKNSAHAIIKYKKLTGEISVGQIGGVDTNLLPNNVLLKEINIYIPEITLEFKNKKYKISY